MNNRILLSFQFEPRDANNQAFAHDPGHPKYRFLTGFHAYFRARGIDVCTIDMWDRLPYDYALFMDVSWRSLLADRFFAHIPRAKRALALIEPPSVNPAPYYLTPMRRRYATVFTWYEPLLARHPYTRIAPMMGVDLQDYRQPPPSPVPFGKRRFLVAINSNRWAYHPHSQYRFRKRVFRFFEEQLGGEFELYGHGWNAPCVFYERWFGHPVFPSYRGVIAGDYDAKIPVLGQYRFVLCAENSARAPGYVSEKLVDAFCARCVPIYNGWTGYRQRVPPECLIDMRDFPRLEDLLAFLRGIDAEKHRTYLDAIESFLHSRAAGSFRDENLHRILHGRFYEGRPPSAGLLD